MSRRPVSGAWSGGRRRRRPGRPVAAAAVGIRWAPNSPSLGHARLFSCYIISSLAIFPPAFKCIKHVKENFFDVFLGFFVCVLLSRYTNIMKGGRQGQTDGNRPYLHGPHATTNHRQQIITDRIECDPPAARILTLLATTLPRCYHH